MNTNCVPAGPPASGTRRRPLFAGRSRHLSPLARPQPPPADTQQRETHLSSQSLHFTCNGTSCWNRTWLMLNRCPVCCAEKSNPCARSLSLKCVSAQLKFEFGARLPRRRQRKKNGGNAGRSLGFASHRHFLPVLWTVGAVVPGPKPACGARVAIFVKGEAPLASWPLILFTRCLPPEGCPELWRLLRRRRRTGLASQRRVDVVTMWKKRSGSAGWRPRPGNGFVANTLEPRRSGIALPSLE